MTWLLCFVIVSSSTLAAQPAAQLEKAAAEITARLSRPAKPAFDRDPAWLKYRECLKLATVWPHPSFRPHLLELLGSPDTTVVVDAAEALLSYHDEAITARVRALTEDPRPYNSGHWTSTVGHMVADLIEHKDLIWQFTPCENGNLLSRKEGYLDLEFGPMTVPQAAESLRSPSLSIRLQAFVWLALRKLTQSTEPFDTAWPSLSPRARQELLIAIPTESISGSELFRRSLENKLSSSRITGKPKTIALIMLHVGTRGSPLARSSGLQIIRQWADSRRQDGADRPKRIRDPVLARVLRAFAEVSDVGDVPKALEWSRSSDRVLRRGGQFILARIDDARGWHIVEAFLRQSKPSTSIIDPWRALCMRVWSDDPPRLQCIEIIASVIDKRLPNISDRYLRRPDSLTVADMFAVMECVAGRTNGNAGLRHPSLAMDVEVARATLRNWSRWIREQREP